jgi:hypothetical protein
MTSKKINFIGVPRFGSMLITRLPIETYLNEKSFDQLYNSINEVNLTKPV